MKGIGVINHNHGRDVFYASSREEVADEFHERDENYSLEVVFDFEFYPVGSREFAEFDKELKRREEVRAKQNKIMKELLNAKK